MAITRLQRRQKKNRLNSIKKQQTIKDLLSRPVIKNIDVEALKAEFGKKSTDTKETTTEKSGEDGEKKQVVKKTTKAKTAKAEKAE